MSYFKRLVPILTSLCLSLQVFAMEPKIPNEFLDKVKTNCFSSSPSTNLKDDLKLYFDGITEYSQLARLEKKPNSPISDEALIRFLDEGLLNKRGGAILPTIAPEAKRVVVIPTSGLDVMIRRLVFMSQHSELWTNAQIFVLIGNHKHREDLLDPGYLKSLPTFFYPSYTEDSSEGREIEAVIDAHLKRILPNAFTHKDGINLIIDILQVLDPKIGNIKNQLQFFSNPEASNSEQIFRHFFSQQKSDMIFVCTGQGLGSAKSLVEKISPEQMIYYAASTDLEPIIEAKVHLTPPNLSINNLLFQLYKRLQ